MKYFGLYLSFFLAVCCFYFARGEILSFAPNEVHPGSLLHVSHSIPNITSYNHVRAFFGGTEGLVVSTDGDVIVRVPPFKQQDLNPFSLRVRHDSVVHEDIYTSGPNVSLIWANHSDIGSAYVPSFGPPKTFFGHPSNFAKKRSVDPVSTSNSILLINCYPTDKAPGDSWWTGYSGKTAAGERTRQFDTVNVLVKKALEQMSYGQLSFDFDDTDFYPLPEDDDYYFWRAADITAAEIKLNNSVTPEEIEEAEAELETAKSRQATPQRAGDMLYDAIKAASDDGVAVDEYDGIMLVIGSDWSRAMSFGRKDSITENRDSGNSIGLKSKTNLWYIKIGSHWGRRAHELSHAIASGDLYSGDGVFATGSFYDLMGSHNNVQLFSGYNIHDKVGWFDDDNVVELKYDSDYPMDDTYTLVAHGLTEDSTANNRYHLIKIEPFEGLTYYVEVRQQPSSVHADIQSRSDNINHLEPAISHVQSTNPDPILFDNFIYEKNSAAGTGNSGILVTKVTMLTHEDLNQKHRTITVLTPANDVRMMEPGETVDDPANNLRITAVSVDSTSYPARWTVRIEWESAVGNPSGLYNLRIRNWDANYQTNDIWIDSEANNWDDYEKSIEGATGNALGNGDRPWVGEGNRYYGYIWNDGAQDATNVQVTYYTNSPPAIGDSGTWVPMDIRFLDMLAGTQSRAADGSDAPIWTPTSDKHTCLKVAISKQNDETNVDDNDAQENIFSFDSEGSSPEKPILFLTQVQNPRNTSALVHIEVLGVPYGWEVTTEYSWLWLPALGVQEMQILIFNDRGREHRLTTSTDKLSTKNEETGACCMGKQGEYYCEEDMLEQHCFSEGGIATFHSNKKCEEIRCGDGGGACCYEGECNDVDNSKSCKGQFVEGKVCSDPDLVCGGRCCWDFGQGSECSDSSRYYDASQCGWGGYDPHRSCDEPCIPAHSNMQMRGVVRGWDFPITVDANVELAEHLSVIGGISVEADSTIRTDIPDVTIGDGIVHFCLEVPKDRPVPSQVSVSVTMKGSDGTSCTVVGKTNEEGCVYFSISSFKCEIVDGCYEMSINVISSDPPLSHTTVGPILIECEGGNCWEKDEPLCKYDPERKKCMREDCPCDPDRPCRQYVDIFGEPYCACEEKPSCKYDAEKKQCMVGFCDDGRLCEAYEVDNGVVCGCAPKQTPTKEPTKEPSTSPTRSPGIPKECYEHGSVNTCTEKCISYPWFECHVIKTSKGVYYCTCGGILLPPQRRVEYEIKDFTPFLFDVSSGLGEKISLEGTYEGSVCAYFYRDILTPENLEEAMKFCFEEEGGEMKIEVAVRELEPRESENPIHMTMIPLRGDSRVSFMWGTERERTFSPARKVFSQDGASNPTSSATQTSFSVLCITTVLFVLLM